MCRAERARPKTKSSRQLQAECDKWNERYPIGTAVTVYAVINPRENPKGKFTTRTKAEVLSGHTAIVWLDNYSGCVALDALEPVAEPPEARQL